MSGWPIAVFLVWVLYGVVQWRRSGKILHRLTQMPRRKRVAIASGCLFGGAVFMLAALYAIFFVAKLQGFALAAATALVGLAFVHAQTMAAAMLVSLAYPGVTEQGAVTSSSQEGN